MSVVYHVAKSGSDWGEGTKENPFLTINKAASVAMPGDTVIVHAGVYREWVKPKNKGLSEFRRITYQAAEGEKVIIKGSERIQNWAKLEGTVWKALVSNDLFGDFNPYLEMVIGDWLVETDNGKMKHLGDVYLNGKSFYEAGSLEELHNPAIKEDMLDNWTQVPTPVRDQSQTKFLWYAEVDEENTTIYANFHEFDPNQELVEINVRKCCFYPARPGIDYITVRGFEMAQAATPWTPPTADQPGLIGPHWSKGWIIENNIIHDAKCSGISIGKEVSTGHNFRTVREDKAGHIYQIESVFSARHQGWSKEKIGSHIIRNNTIYDCGQNGIVGHLGCVFSEIYNNHIYNIALKREFYGHEIAGIKLHAPIDVLISQNRIHDCTLGTWMDWQTQGTRITRNLLYRNNRDLFIEVSHGPFVVDHNIFASAYTLQDWAQGGAYINNLVAGEMMQRDVIERATPYHLPHSTKVAGFAAILGGDNRFFNNIFVKKDPEQYVGTSHFDGYTTSMEEYSEQTYKKFGYGAHHTEAKQPVYIENNVYLNGATPFEKEKDNIVLKDFDPKIRIIEEGEQVYLSCSLPREILGVTALVHGTDSLEKVRIVDLEFDNPDGSPLQLDEDYFQEKREQGIVGPIENLKPGENKIKVWG